MIYLLELAGLNRDFDFRFFFEHDGQITYDQVSKKVAPMLSNTPYTGEFGGMDQVGDELRLRNLKDIDPEDFEKINGKSVSVGVPRCWQLQEVTPVSLEDEDGQ